MALTITNSLITVQDANGAVQSPANGGTFQYTPGTLLNFALASTSGVQRWTLMLLCPAFPSLHQQTFEWTQGQANLLSVPMPAYPSAGINPRSGIQVVSVVSDGSGGAVPSSVYSGQSRGGAAVPMQHACAYVIVAALPAYTNTNGVLTGTGNAAITSTMADGQTPAVGDFFLLEQGRAASAADVGIYQIQVVGSGSVPFVAVRAPDMPQGATLLPKTEVLVQAGTVFGGTTWVNTLAGLTNLVGTASFTFFPRQVTYTAALVAGVITAGASSTTNAPTAMSVMSATLTQLAITRRTASGTTSTIAYAYNGNPTPGGLGTGSASAMATVAAGTVNASDVSTVDVTLINPC